MSAFRHIRIRWPEVEVPQGEPEWFLYEIDDSADAVVRSVELYQDGSATRNSIEIEERNGAACPSLIDCSLERGFEGADLDTLPLDEFESAWRRGVDKPFWNVG